MNHLTTNQLFELIDGAIANGVKSKLLEHVEVCPRCRGELEFQRKLEGAARRAPLAMPARNLVSVLMGKIAPRGERTWASKLIDNLGNILAMGLVLTVVWYVIANPGPLQGSRQPSAFSDAVKTYVQLYSSARDFVAKEQVRLVGEPAKDRSQNTDNIVVLTVISVLILIAVDRFVVRRVIKIRA